MTELGVICRVARLWGGILASHGVSPRFLVTRHNRSKRLHSNGRSRKVEIPNIDIHEYLDSTVALNE